MGFWNRVKKDLQIAVKEGTELIKEGTSVLTAEARRVSKKGTATMSVEARKMMKEGFATAKKGAASVKAEAGRMARIANLRYQLFRQNQMAQNKFAEIGGAVYDHSLKGSRKVRLNGKVQKLVKEAERIEGRIGKLKSEIDRLSMSQRR
ncbi:MAG: hypothetical protein HY349_06265 [Nitrospirae bacterium]|nr:hypothetical protein [Nitrospirota bacterium]